MNTTEKLHLDIKRDHKAEIGDAAQRLGMSVSAFVRMAALKEARRVNNEGGNNAG